MSKTDLFVEKSKAKHGDLYDYSKSIYSHSRTPVIIGCKAHGDFLQKPVHHQLGKGCQKCAKETTSKKRTFTNEQFIALSNKKHNSQYDYSSTEYVHSQKKVKIRCKFHGIFEQLPNSHLQGAGCASCNIKKASLGKMISTEVFIDRAKKVHGDTYEYHNAIYLGSRKNLNINCKKHGEFKQLPSVHLEGKGCAKCGLERMSHDLDSFIAKSISVHGRKYDYSKSIYVGNKEKVIIICREHGEFRQMAMTHMCGSGCAKCAQEENGWSRSRHTKAAERNNHSMIYLIECFNDKERFYKVGITTHTINRRFNGKECMPYSFNVLCTKTDGAKNDWNNEKTIHSKLKEFKYTPLIRFKGDGECFLELNDYVKQFFGVEK